MSLLADQLVVVGRGRMVASGPVTDFIRSSDRNSVIVRSPDIELLGPRLAELGGFVEVDPQDDDSVAEGRQPRYAVKRLSLEERSEEHTSELQSRGHIVCRL